MTVLQIASAEAPYNRPALGVRAARLLGLAEAMGLLPTAAPIARLDRRAILGPVRHLLRQGIGRNAALEFETAADPERLAELLDRLHAELLASPTPHTEAHQLGDLLGLDLLARLTSASPTSLRRYAAGERTAPDDVAARLHHLAVIVSHLAGGYNDFGIRRWFLRPRPQLKGRSPATALGSDWDPDGGAAQQVLRLAEALNSSPAT
ncbi:MAG TPA: hypothetical protein VGQ42_07660 [Candidatus Dormibacteraeota bacterium]|jgi:hypothetical protein|nr:hypothetical protein [Candidatus Dormibacteraeota bacterium]